MYEVRQALDAVGLPNGFHTGGENLLSDIVRLCGRVAGLVVPDELRRVWGNVSRI
jgi:hypothetical protein